MVMNHGSGLAETNIFLEFSVAAADVGTTFTMAFDAKRPSSNECGGTNADNGATGGVCQAFIKVLNPGNGYAAEPGVYKETTGLSQTEWTSHTINS